MKYEFYQPRQYQVASRFYTSFISVFADKIHFCMGSLYSGVINHGTFVWGWRTVGNSENVKHISSYTYFASLGSSYAIRILLDYSHIIMKITLWLQIRDASVKSHNCAWGNHVLTYHS